MNFALQAGRLLPALLALGALPAQAADYFATTLERFDRSLTWITCGSTATSSGCFGAGSIGPFGRMCSVVGSNTRVVVADTAADSGQTTLFVYALAESTTPTMTLLRAVRLPSTIPPSGTARCEMALLNNYVYFGTSESATYAQVNLRNYGVKTGSVCGTPTSAITAGPDAAVVSQSGCFVSFDTNGIAQLSGGESSDKFVPGTKGFAP